MVFTTEGSDVSAEAPNLEQAYRIMGAEKLQSELGKMFVPSLSFGVYP